MARETQGGVLGWACMGSGALGAWLGSRIAGGGSVGSNMLLGALIFMSSGPGVFAALAPCAMLRAFRERGTAMEKARAAPLGGIVWSWLVYGLAHSVLGESRLWWAALAVNTIVCLVGLWRLDHAVIVDE